jgi:peptidoglycan/xylan/chitin deacetylase (PgdA/CDA1 family)
LEWKAFIEQVRWLNNHFHTVTPEEVEKFAYAKADLPGPSFFLSFDDGLVDHTMTEQEILGPLNMKAAFSVSSKPLVEGRALMVNKIHWLRATTLPEKFRKEFLHLLPEKWLDVAAYCETTREAVQNYPYDTPGDASLKYLINFQLPHELVDAIASEMLRNRGKSEASFCNQVYMTERQICQLTEKGHIIVNHGHSHTPFSRLNGGDLAKEIQKSKSFFEGVTGAIQGWVSYPNGRQWAIPKDTKEFCRHFGFTIGLGLDGGWNNGSESPYRLNRVNQNDIKTIV